MLSPDVESAKITLLSLQVTTRSTLGAVAFHTGGVLVDHGFVRLLGGGCARLPHTMTTWSFLPDALVVGFDAIGGIFAMNGGALAGQPGHICYFAADSLEWESLELGYSDFISFLLSGSLDDFYRDLRWPGWQSACTDLAAGAAFSQYPPLFTAEGKPGQIVSRRPVDIVELARTNFDIARQLDGR